MYRRKRRILKSLVLGFAVAAFAAPAALGWPLEPGSSPNHPDFWNYDPQTGEKIADTSPGVAPADLMGIYRGATSVGPDDRSLYRGTSPQLDPSIVGSPDDRAVFRGVETPNVPVNLTVSSDSDGFQWSDAGLGAASTLALVLLMGAATLLIRHQRRRIAVF